jgi:hypothetical protein
VFREFCNFKALVPDSQLGSSSKRISHASLFRHSTGSALTMIGLFSIFSPSGSEVGEAKTSAPILRPIVRVYDPNPLVTQQEPAKPRSQPADNFLMHQFARLCGRGMAQLGSRRALV